MRSSLTKLQVVQNLQRNLETVYFLIKCVCVDPIHSCNALTETG